MSTKAIRKTLEWAQEQLEDSLDRPFSRDQTKLDERRLADVKVALAEVEAIERAAKDYRHRPSTEATEALETLLGSIAKDAP